MNARVTSSQQSEQGAQREGRDPVEIVVPSSKTTWSTMSGHQPALRGAGQGARKPEFDSLETTPHQRPRDRLAQFVSPQLYPRRTSQTMKKYKTIPSSGIESEFYTTYATKSRSFIALTVHMYLLVVSSRININNFDEL